MRNAILSFKFSQRADLKRPVQSDVNCVVSNAMRANKVSGIGMRAHL